MGDFWRDVKAHKKSQAAKFAANAEKALQRLRDAGYVLQDFNDETHYKIFSANIEFLADYWPTTGTWILHTGKRGSMVIPLLKRLKELEQCQTKL